MKKQWISLLLLLPPLILGGCGCRRENDSQTQAAATPTPVPVEIIEIVNEPESGEVNRRAVYTVNGEAAQQSDTGFQSSAGDENAILVSQGGSLILNTVDVDKTGDASGGVFSRSTGVNAAVAVVGSSTLSMNGGAITAGGYAADGISAVGEGAAVNLCGVYVAASGEASVCVVAAGGAKIKLDNVTASAAAADAACIALFSGGEVTLTGTKLISSGGPLISLTEGSGSVSLSEQELSGAVSVAGEGTLRFSIQNNSVFTGTFSSEDARGVSVHIDDSCVWAVTADTEIGVLVDTDATLSNIHSGGFTVYYDSQAEENAWLNAGMYPLPGGGYLTPRI